MKTDYDVNSEFTQEVRVKVVARADVLVCGGGTAGCVAALAAARNGASVILLESGYFLGGMISEGNAGLTKFIVHGKDEHIQADIVKTLRKKPEEVQLVGGIPLELVHRLIERKGAVGTGGTAASYVYTDSQEFKLLLFEMMREEGVRVELHSPVCDVLRDDKRLAGVVTQTKGGRLAYLGEYIVDATGDGDVASLGGVPCVLGVGPDDEAYKHGLSKLGALQHVGSMFRIGGVDFDRYIEHIKKNPDAFMVQPFGQMSREDFLEAYEKGEMVIGLGLLPSGRKFQIYNYPHPNIMIAVGSPIGWAKDENEMFNGLDADDLTRAEYAIMVAAKNQVGELRENVPGFENAYVLDTPRAGIRETRHVVGEYKLNIFDVLKQRDFEDTIGKGCHPVDIHPFPRELEHIKDKEQFYFNIPYRSLVAKDVDNLLVAGRCLSATREASGCTRPTASCMVTGEAAGTAAALCVGDNVPAARDINVGRLRAQLKKQGAVI